MEVNLNYLLVNGASSKTSPKLNIYRIGLTILYTGILSRLKSSMESSSSYSSSSPTFSIYKGIHNKYFIRA